MFKVKSHNNGETAFQKVLEVNKPNNGYIPALKAKQWQFTEIN
jgi:hypothetical protein